MKQYKSFEDGFKDKDPAFFFLMAKKSPLKDIDFEAMAIKIASLSGQEKPSFLFNEPIPQPKIGSILVAGDKVFCSARSGLEIGDHAEYTVLETMGGKSDLRNAVLYTTLEPCTAESRHPWTKSCSRLIVDKKIKKVFVGTIDANYLVTGMGIKYLFDHDVEVLPFDSSLSNGLKTINKEFFEFFEKSEDSKAIRLVDKCLGKKIDWDVASFYQKSIRGNEPSLRTVEMKLAFYREMIAKGEIGKGDEISRVRVSKTFALLFYLDPSIEVAGFGVSLYLPGSNGSEGKNKKRKVIRKSLIRMMSSDPIFWNEENVVFRIINALDPNYLSSPKENDIKEELNKVFASGVSARELIYNSLAHNDYSSCSNISFKVDGNVLKITDFVSLSPNDIDVLNKGEMNSIPTNPRLMDALEQCKIVEQSQFGMSCVSANAKDLPSSRDENGKRVKMKTFSGDSRKGKSILITSIPLKRHIKIL
ncbi:MAG: hypothetical protein LKG11_03810 [Bacilli bacterium]|jgi:pyrimidine deaminase RibD-like protein|nr:hypothetical protein [Bacilli bacterium]